MSKKRGKIMNNNYYLPEGELLYTQDNTTHISSITGLERAMREGKILEAIAIMCDEELNLHIDLFGLRAIIPKCEAVLTQNGEEIKDIAVITRVGKPVSFKVLSVEETNGSPNIILSRKAAQLECRNYYLSSLRAGDIIPAKVTHLDTFGAFVDIGCGCVSLLSIDCISVSRISHPCDRLSAGQRINVAVKSNDTENGRIYVTLKELLGTWEENVENFCVGQTVSGIVRSIESYGIFIELAPNLAGLAELRYDNPMFDSISVGDAVCVYIKSIIPEKMKIKLVLIDLGIKNATPSSLKYYTDQSCTHISEWCYSPTHCIKMIKTVFE